jgi:hypothetical protein
MERRPFIVLLTALTGCNATGSNTSQQQTQTEAVADTAVPTATPGQATKTSTATNTPTETEQPAPTTTETETATPTAAENARDYLRSAHRKLSLVRNNADGNMSLEPTMLSLRTTITDKTHESMDILNR